MFKRMKKGLSCLMATVILLGTVFMTAVPSVYADEPAFAGGDGSADAPYEILTAEQLNQVRNHLDAYFKLTENIDLTDYLAEGGAGYNGGKGWEPIGTEGEPFDGRFDGNGRTIHGLKINRPDEDTQGLFGFAGEDAVLRNVDLADVNVSGNNGVGGLAGNNKGLIIGSHVSGTVAGKYAIGGLAGYNNGSITNSNATSTLIGSGENVGGLVGENFSSIMTSYAGGAVTGAKDLGGLVGKNNGTIERSYATGAVTSSQYGAGGLVGYNNGGRISECYATGAVKSYGVGDNVGGLMSVNSAGIITSSYATGSVEGSDHVGGLLGHNSGTISFSYASGDVKARNEAGGLAGWNNGSGHIDNSYATGAVTGQKNVGGLSGINEGFTLKSYARGAVTGSENVGGLVGYHKQGYIEHTYATGAVTGQHDVGGLTGLANESLFSSYYDKETTGSSDQGKGEGKTSAEMMTRSTYAEWDFNSTWRIGERKNNGYPYLSLVPLIMVIYDDNGSTSSSVPDFQSYPPGSVVTVSDQGDLTNPNLTFVGWNTQSDGQGTHYAAGTTFKVGMSDVILYAKWTADPTYTVTYNGNGSTGGSVPSDNNAYEQGQNVTVLRNSGDLVKKGHTFAGWNTQADGQGTDYAAGATFAMGTENVTLYAKWTASPTYTVTYDDNGSTEGYVPIDNQAYEQGETVTVLRNSGDLWKTGYRFAGWNTQADGQGTDYAAGATFAMGTENVTLYAKWEEKPTYTVTYDDNGSTEGYVPIDSHAYEQGETVTVLRNSGDLWKTGYRFAGWNTQADGQGTNYATGATFAMGTSNVTLYAKWEAKPTYTVTYDDNGSTEGYVPTDSRAYEQGETVTVLRNSGDLWKTGYRFAGWNTQADGQGTSYAAGATFVMGTSNIILYAKWIANPTYTVTYDDNGSTDGGVPSDNNVYEKGQTVTVLRNSGDLVKAGHTFAGWNTQADGQGTDYAAGATFAMGTENVTLYAKWTAKPTYTVTYNGNGSTGGSVPADSGAYESGSTVTVLGNTGNLTKSGHTFAGWNTQADGQGTSYATGATFEIGTANVTLYAKWTANPTYTVTYNGNGSTGGSVPADSGAYESGETVTVLGNTGNLTKSGYTFAGWNTQADGQGADYTASKTFVITKDTVLYAKWSIVNDNNGNGNNNPGNIGYIPPFPSDNTVTSTDGKLTLPAGKAGRVSLGDEIVIVVPADATDKELIISIEKLLDTQKLLTQKEILVSPVFDVKKNFPENFNKLVTLTIAFDPKGLKNNQKAAVFYYDEAKKSWVEVGGKVNGDRITAEVNYFAKFTVFAVDTAVKDPSTDTKPNISFSDVSGHWAENSIKQAATNGIASGYPDGTFRPNTAVTRVEFAVMLVNTLKPQGEGAALTFTDTTKIGTWAQKAVAQAVQAGIIKGYEDGSFRPDAVITRSEMAAMIARALQQTDELNAATGFADDKDIPLWARSAVAAIKKLGIIEGRSTNKFAPDAKTTRAEAVTVLLRMLVHMSK
ncbi:InlB B-repeat-containing protein [Paenibacillus sp. GCM10027626]|uniref:InlB B-repeat-containing protein n=1 Tax=Paenibacillus sp. GCM10027626 TaxID=3273411 RepID=UPI00363D8001